MSVRNIHIQGDKTNFISKGAIERFKNDLRQSTTIDPLKYLKDGWKYKIESENDKEIKVNIEENVGEKKENLLFKKLKFMREQRKSNYSVEHHMKKTNKELKDQINDVPHDIMNAYTRLKKSGNPVISPVDVLKNISEHKKTLQQVLESFKGPSNPFIEYYRDVLRWIKDM